MGAEPVTATRFPGVPGTGRGIAGSGTASRAPGTRWVCPGPGSTPRPWAGTGRRAYADVGNAGNTTTEPSSSRAISIATSVVWLSTATPSPSRRIRWAARIRRSTSSVVNTGRNPLGRASSSVDRRTRTPAMLDSSSSRRCWSRLSARVKFSNRLPGSDWACSTACRTTTRRFKAKAGVASSRWARKMPPWSSIPGNDLDSVPRSTGLSSGGLSLGGRHQRDTRPGVPDRRLVVPRVHRLGGILQRGRHDVPPDLLHRAARGEILKHLPLVLRQQRREETSNCSSSTRDRACRSVSGSMPSADRSPSENFANSRGFGDDSATRCTRA